MPYIGKQLSNGNYLKLDDISSSFNGSTTTFSLTNGGSAYYPGSEFSILVSVGGVIQEPESAYQISNDEITFANAPTAQDSFFCVVLGDAIGINVPGNNTVNGAQMAKPFNYDGGLLYLDDSNNKVGINSTSPSVALDVVGDLNVSGNITGIGGTLGGTLVGNVYASSGISTFNDLRVTNNLTVEGTTTTLDTNLIGVDRVEVGANSNTIVGVAITQSGTADILQLFDGSTKVVTIDDEGKVGIGTDVPAEALEIGKGHTDPVIRLNDVDNRRMSIRGPSANNIASVGTESNNDLMFFTNGYSNEKLRITSAGKIQVKGTRAGNLQPEDDDTLQIYTKSADNSINRGSGITFYNHDNSGYEMGGTIQVAKENGTADDEAAYMRFSTRPAGSAAQERLRIDSSGRLLLGTTTEGAANADNVTLSGTGDVGMTFRSTDSGTNRLFFSDATSGAGEYAGFIVYDHSSNYMEVGTNETTRLRITSTGEVGINMTPSNGQMLAITGRSGYDDIVQVTAVGTNMGARINLTNTGTGVARINATNNSLALQTGGTERLSILSDGKVGINDTSPDSIFSVKDTYIFSCAGGNATTGMQIGGYDAGANSYNPISIRASQILFSISGTEKLRINSSGALCVGTTSGPGEIGLYLGDGTNPAGHIYANGTHHLYLLANAYYAGGWKYLGNGEANSLALQDGDFLFNNASANSSGAGQAITWSEKFRIDSSGRVMIATTDAGRSGADELTIGSASGDNGITIRSGTDSEGNIYFSDGSSGGVEETRGIIRYDHDDDAFTFFTGTGSAWSAERLRIDSNGNLSLGAETNNSDIHSSYRCLQVYKSAYIWGYSSSSYPAVHITNNARPTTSSFTGGWKRDLAGTYTAPVQLELYTGNFNVRTADNSTADSAITWDTRFTVRQDGKVGVNDSNPNVSFSVKSAQASHYMRVENTGSSSTYNGFSLKTPTLDCQIWNQGPSGTGYGGANSMNFYQAGTYGAFAFFHGTDERFRIATGNVVSINKNAIPTWYSTIWSAANSGGGALHVGGATVLYEDSYSSGNDNYSIWGNNVYLGSGSQNLYLKNDAASRIYQHDGNFWFQQAGAGTAGNAITFTTPLKITSDGKVGINESSPGSQLVVRATTDDNPSILIYRNSGGGDVGALSWGSSTGTNARINWRGGGGNVGMSFLTSAAGNDGSVAERLRITSSGIEVHNISGKMIDCQTSGATGSCYIQLSDSTGSQKGYIGYGSGSNEQLYIVQQESADITVYTGSASRWYYKTDGQLNSATDGAINIYGGANNHTNDAIIYGDKTSSADWVISANAQTNDYGIYTRVGQYAAYGLAVYDHSNSVWKFRVNGAGTIYAAATTITSISDRRLKQNIVDANSQWDDIKGLKFKNFQWKDVPGYAQADGKTYLGLISDEVEPISPNLIDPIAQTKEDIENEVPDPEYKGVKYSIVWMKAVKALQEAQARIETLEAKVAALEGS